MLQSMGSQRVRHDLVIEQQQLSFSDPSIHTPPPSPVSTNLSPDVKGFFRYNKDLKLVFIKTRRFSEAWPNHS